MNYRTVLNYLMSRVNKSEAKIVKPSDLVYKSIREIKPSVNIDSTIQIQAAATKGKQKEAPKAKDKGQIGNKIQVKQEEPMVLTNNKVLEVLDEKSLTNESSISQLDTNDISQQNKGMHIS